LRYHGWVHIDLENIMTTGKSLIVVPGGYYKSTNFQGPNSITYEFSSWNYFHSPSACFRWNVLQRIWKAFIPFPSYQVFQRGAYYSVEVIPDALAVVSLNTMYFYDSNKGAINIMQVGPFWRGIIQRLVAASSRILMTLGI
jgi:hypothetical protein